MKRRHDLTSLSENSRFDVTFSPVPIDSKLLLMPNLLKSISNRMISNTLQPRTYFVSNAASK